MEKILRLVTRWGTEVFAYHFSVLLSMAELPFLIPFFPLLHVGSGFPSPPATQGPRFRLQSLLKHLCFLTSGSCPFAFPHLLLPSLHINLNTSSGHRSPLPLHCPSLPSAFASK